MQKDNGRRQDDREGGGDNGKTAPDCGHSILGRGSSVFDV